MALGGALAMAGAGAAGVGAATPTPTHASDTLDEVTVTARRTAELTRRVQEFVSQIAALENNESVPRWQMPVCPQVAGLPEDEGEFVLGRLSQIARAASVPLAGEHCRPNLYIVVTADPKGLLERTTLTNRLLAFGSVSPSVIDEFIATPRPVRVWYKTSMETSLGLPLGDTNPVPPPSVFSPRTFTQNNSSARLSANVIYGFSTVIAIVDQTQVQGLTQGQFADYIAMVSFADLKPGAHLGDAPTILKLFDGAPAAAPAGLSVWDQAFLKSLYTTEQKSRLQRNQMTHEIVREVTR